MSSPDQETGLNQQEVARREAIRGIVESIAGSSVPDIVCKLNRQSPNRLDIIGKDSYRGVAASPLYGIMLAESEGRGTSLAITSNGVRLVSPTGGFASESLVMHYPDNLVPDRLFDEGECLGDISADDFRNRVIRILEKYQRDGGDALANLLKSLKDSV